ncbi:MAG TPA: hypothetical protein VI750_00015, partial [Pyrinomonadaceae bacterium]|nr:hypothetical protein [Pyrinomonadaceae bacterium]
ACRYEPELNPTYTDLAEHYGICVLPARPARPRDKAKVENGVLIAKRWILAVLRHRTFYSLAELNGVIGELLERLNGRALRKLKQSRRELFQLFDHPNALSLPQKPYEYAEWKLATVNIDYHIEVERHYYSVPFRLIREKIHVRLTAHTVEAFFKGERVLAHVRSYVPYGHTTIAAATGSLVSASGVDCDGDGIIDLLPGEPLVCRIAFSGEGIGQAILGLVQAAVAIPAVVNELVSFVPTTSTFRTTSNTSGCPAGFVGKFGFNARLTDKNTSPPLSDLMAKVTTLTNGNLLQNADGGPAGVGATLTVPRTGGFADGTLNPNESVDVPFTICLKQMKAFSFFVDVLGLTQ